MRWGVRLERWAPTPVLAWLALAGDPRARGRIGEELAARRLAGAGWRLLARGARTPWAQLDLFGRDGRAWVGVEVKTGVAPRGLERDRAPRYRPLDRLRPRRLERQRRAVLWLAARADASPPGGRGELRSRVRVDLLELVLTPRRLLPPRISWTHLRDVGFAGAGGGRPRGAHAPWAPGAHPRETGTSEFR